MTTRPLIHVAAHALPGATPFAEPEARWWTWHRLRAAWPEARAACLMLDHLHLITRDELEAARSRLGAILSGFTRRAGARRIWAPLELGRIIPDAKHLARQIRYVHLNPPRAQLAKDPLAWACSTHRGAVGAEVDPWVSADTLAEELEWPRLGFEERFHAYVSGDPSVDVAGTPFPSPAVRRDWPSVPLDRIVLAGLSATPWSPASERRERIVELAVSQGWRDSRVIARALGVTERAVRRIRARADDEASRAALLCLGDARLCLSAELVKRRGNASPKAPPPWRRS
jgi:hypothetical protein